MKFAAKATADFEIVPSGNYVGICNAVIDLGTQPGSGMYPQSRQQVYIRFELPTERIKYQKNGKDMEGPMSMGTTLTASMSEKANLRKLIESWFGKKFPSDEAAADFDVKQLLGKRCLLNVTHTEKGQKVYANIGTATPLPRGMVSEEKQHNPSLYYSLEEHDERVFGELPEWLRKKIDARIRVDKAPASTPQEKPDFYDDIPF